MTHVMRWMGSAVRCQDVAVEYVAQREGFGGKLADLGMIQQMIAEQQIDLAAARLLIKACHELDADGTAGRSIAKTFAAGISEDRRHIQMCGEQGDPAGPVAGRTARPFRIYDGPSGASLGHRPAPSTVAQGAATGSEGRAHGHRSRRGQAARFLVDQGVDVGELTETDLISGGKSNLTFGVAVDGKSNWVVRRPPTGGLTPSAHDMNREWAVTHAACRARRCRWPPPSPSTPRVR